MSITCGQPSNPLGACEEDRPAANTRQHKKTQYQSTIASTTSDIQKDASSSTASAAEQTQNVSQTFVRHQPHTDVSDDEMAEGLTAPHFNGNDSNATQWLNQFKAYSALKGFDDKKKIGAFYLHLRDGALDWFSSLCEPIRTKWTDLEAAFKDRYGPSQNSLWSREKAFFAMTQKSGQTALDFIAAIESKGALLNLDAGQIQRTAIGGLNPTTRTFLLQNNPDNMDEVRRLVALVDSTGTHPPPNKSQQLMPAE